jgi:hypothetical protein
MSAQRLGGPDRQRGLPHAELNLRGPHGEVGAQVTDLAWTCGNSRAPLLLSVDRATQNEELEDL